MALNHTRVANRCGAMAKPVLSTRPATVLAEDKLWDLIRGQPDLLVFSDPAPGMKSAPGACPEALSAIARDYKLPSRSYHSL